MRGDLDRLAVICAGVIASHAVALWLVRLGTAQDIIVEKPPMVMLLITEPPAHKPPDTALGNTVKVRDTQAIRRAPAPKPLAQNTTAPAIHSVQPLFNTAPAPPDATDARPAGGPVQLAATNTQKGPKPESEATAMASPAKAFAPPLQLPSSNADYLNNPAPVYPAISQRLGEQGQVIVRVLIGKDGLAHQGEVSQSSGYERLDQAALRAVLGWRFVPGQRAGVPQDMWFNVPVSFTLK